MLTIQHVSIKIRITTIIEKINERDIVWIKKEKDISKNRLSDRSTKDAELSLNLFLYIYFI